MDLGTEVEVRNSFTGTWSPGFAVGRVEPGAGGEPRIWVRRLSDGWQLPTGFSAADVRVRSGQPAPLMGQARPA